MRHFGGVRMALGKWDGKAEVKKQDRDTRKDPIKWDRDANAELIK